jgi:hypothetical protein
VKNHERTPETGFFGVHCRNVHQKAWFSHLLRCSHIFDSLKIPEPHPVSENELQTLLCDHLQPFMLELSKDNHYFNVRLYELLDGAGERLMRGEKP